MNLPEYADGCHSDVNAVFLDVRPVGFCRVKGGSKIHDKDDDMKKEKKTTRSVVYKG